MNWEGRRLVYKVLFPCVQGVGRETKASLEGGMDGAACMPYTDDDIRRSEISQEHTHLTTGPPAPPGCSCCGRCVCTSFVCIYDA